MQVRKLVAGASVVLASLTAGAAVAGATPVSERGQTWLAVPELVSGPYTPSPLKSGYRTGPPPVYGFAGVSRGLGGYTPWQVEPVINYWRWCPVGPLGDVC